MKNPLTLLIAVVIVVVLLAYMFVFQVRYDEVAVLTTFGKAGSSSIKHTRKWPYLRWPWPIQGVTRYSTRLRVLEDQLEELQTQDQYAVIVSTFLAWRISDPLQFFSQLHQVDEAETQLLDRLRDARAVISGYQFDQLVNVKADQVKLADIETSVEGQLQKQVLDDNYGIEIEQFGIRRILLPESVTENVFEQMREKRQRMAENTRASGDADARKIKSEAKSIKDRILAFANGFAEEIRAKGDREAQEYFKEFEKDEDFAIFIRRMKALPKIYKDGTLILPAEPLMTPDQSIMGLSITQK